MAFAGQRGAHPCGRDHPRARRRRRRWHGGHPNRPSPRRRGDCFGRQPGQACPAQNTRRLSCRRFAPRRFRRGSEAPDRKSRRRRRAQRARGRSHPHGPLLPRGIRTLHRDRQTRHLPELEAAHVAPAQKRVLPRGGHGRRLCRRRRPHPRTHGGNHRAGRRRQAASAFAPIFPRQPPRRRFPSHGRRQTHGQSHPEFRRAVRLAPRRSPVRAVPG